MDGRNSMYSIMGMAHDKVESPFIYCWTDSQTLNVCLIHSFLIRFFSENVDYKLAVDSDILG